MVPIMDGRRVYNIGGVSLKQTCESEGRAIVTAFEKAIMLHVIDEAWKENLRELDELKHSVQNASYEQKDPLLIFKLESVKLFDKMVNRINNQTISILMRGQVPEQQVQAPDDAAQQRAAYEAQRRARAAAQQRAQYQAGRGGAVPGTTQAPNYSRPPTTAVLTTPKALPPTSATLPSRQPPLRTPAASSPAPPSLPTSSPAATTPVPAAAARSSSSATARTCNTSQKEPHQRGSFYDIRKGIIGRLLSCRCNTTSLFLCYCTMPAACAPSVVSRAVMIVITISATLFSVFFVLSFMGLKFNS